MVLEYSHRAAHFGISVASERQSQPCTFQSRGAESRPSAWCLRNPPQASGPPVLPNDRQQVRTCDSRRAGSLPCGELRLVARPTELSWTADWPQFSNSCGPVNRGICQWIPPRPGRVHCRPKRPRAMDPRLPRPFSVSVFSYLVVPLTGLSAELVP